MHWSFISFLNLWSNLWQFMPMMMMVAECDELWAWRVKRLANTPSVESYQYYTVYIRISMDWVLTSLTGEVHLNTRQSHEAALLVNRWRILPIIINLGQLSHVSSDLLSDHIRLNRIDELYEYSENLPYHFPIYIDNSFLWIIYFRFISSDSRSCWPESIQARI